MNIFVDPTGLARASKLRDTAFCVGTYPSASEETSKARRFELLNPQTVVIGTSAVRNGFYELDLIETARSDKVFNFGVNGLTATRIAKLLPHIAKASDTQTLIVGVNYGMFLRRQQSHDRAPNIWADENQSLFLDDPFYRAFLTMPATKASLRSLLFGCDPRSFSVNGFLTPDVEFAPFESDALKSAIQAWTLIHASKTGRVDHSGPFAIFMESLSEVCFLGKKIDLFMEPAHALTNDIIYKEGWWQDAENWKRELTQSVAKLKAKGCKITLTDFFGYNHVTISPFSNEYDPNKYYSDLTHYKPIVGKKILQRLGGAKESVPFDSFGVLLTPKTVELQIMRIREERDAYVKAQ